MINLKNNKELVVSEIRARVFTCAERQLKHQTGPVSMEVLLSSCIAEAFETFMDYVYSQEDLENDLDLY